MNWLRRGVHAMKDSLFPAMCFTCDGRLLSGEDYLCTDCLMQLPREYDSFEEMLAGWGRIEKAVAAWRYDPRGLMSRVIMQMKYHGRDDLCRYMGELAAMTIGAEKLFADIDCIIPVPLHPRRRKERGYNQSEEIALGVSKVIGKEVVSDALERTLFVDSQTRMSHEERQENVEGVFRVINDERIKGRRVLLIDDIITTGATIGNCCMAVAKVEGIQINVMSMALTKRG